MATLSGEVAPASRLESNLFLVNKLLERGMDNQDARKLSDREPVPVMVYAADGRSAKLRNNYSEAPAGSTAIIPVHGTMLKYGTYCSYGTVEYAELIQAPTSARLTAVAKPPLRSSRRAGCPNP